MRTHIVAQLTRDLIAFDMLAPQDADTFTEWAMTLHPARLGNAYSLAGLAVGLRDDAGQPVVEVPWGRAADEVANLAAVMRPSCAEWAAFNRRQGCLPGIATPLPLSRKHDANLMTGEARAHG